MTGKRLSNQATALLIIFALACTAKAGDRRDEALFEQGYTFYQQHLASSALERFKEAAELGHVEAAYYAGNIIRQNHTFITEESEQFYRQAAEGGDVYAMLRLAAEDSVCGTLRNCDYDHEAWIDRALDTALPLAEAGDTEAMMALSSVYAMKGESSEDFEWVERAAENGHVFAQYWMAVMLDEQNRGFYWTEARRFSTQLSK